jgi:RNA polymerase sigma-70 factor (ECF subfamily)
MDRFKRLCWPLLGALLRSARFLTRSEAEAEDLVQDTLMKALRAMDSYREGTDVKAWLMTIMRRTQIDFIRAKGRRLESISLNDRAGFEPEGQIDCASAGVGRDCSDPEALLEQFEDPDIANALKVLPEAIRWTLLLVDVEGLDYQEAAGILGVPVGTIKSRAHRGRRMLYASLRQRYERESQEGARPEHASGGRAIAREDPGN